MKTLSSIGIFLLVILVLYWTAFISFNHRYRLTVEVETPDGMKTGSSVTNVRASAVPRILTERTYSTGLQGEATFVDLGRGKTLFALLSRGSDAMDVDANVELALRAFQIPICGLWCFVKASWLRGRRDLSENLYPTLATFLDTNDPKTAVVIDPKDFTSVFGPGYRLKRIWIEMTRAPVTHEIKNTLSWLDGFRGISSGARQKVPGNAGKNLYASHFIRRDP